MTPQINRDNISRRRVRPVAVRAKEAKPAASVTPAGQQEVVVKVVLEHAPVPVPPAPPTPVAAVADTSPAPVYAPQPYHDVVVLPPPAPAVAQPPGFHIERQGGGYNAREVDAYIDRMRTENDRLSLVNGQLFSLWLTEIKEIARTGGRIPERPGSSDTISWETIDQLLSYSYGNAELRSIATVATAPTAPALAPEPVVADRPEPVKKKSRARSIISGVLFYGVLAALVLVVYLFGMSNPTAPPRDIGGFSAMTVLTRSMQDVLPQNSFIVTRRVDPNTIRVGDDITFLMPNNTTITHRVIDIIPNFQNTGAPGFQTQGTMNPRPDADVVLAANLVGQVIFSNLAIGNAVIFIRTNLLLVGIMLVLAIAIIVVLKKLVFTSKPEAKSVVGHEPPRQMH